MAIPLRIQAMGWFALLALAPLLLMLTTPVPAKGGFWWESGIALGFGALGLLLGQFLLTARLRLPTAPFGIDIIYYFHRYAASAIPVLVLALGLMLLILVALIVTVRLIRPWRLAARPRQLVENRAERGESRTLVLRPVGHNGMRFTPACVDGPYGIFSCSHYPQAAGFVFIAGGIGVAPVISMLEGLQQADDKRQHFLFAAHSEFERIPRREDITALATNLNLTSVQVLESPPARAWCATASHSLGTL